MDIGGTTSSNNYNSSCSSELEDVSRKNVFLIFIFASLLTVFVKVLEKIKEHTDLWLANRDSMCYY